MDWNSDQSEGTNKALVQISSVARYATLVLCERTRVWLTTLYDYRHTGRTRERRRYFQISAVQLVDLVMNWY